MAYNQFKLEPLLDQFNLELREVSNLFGAITPRPPSEMLTTQLRENVDLAVAISTEKARSELIIAPVLLEVRRQLNYKIGLFSGVEFNIEPEVGLNGFCDFLLSATSDQLRVKAPVVTLVEAKNENLRSGLSQCIAEMVAAQRFNQQRGNNIDTIYGVVIIGTIWQFLTLEDSQVSVNLREYYLHEVGHILGILSLPFRSPDAIDRSSDSDTSKHI